MSAGIANAVAIDPFTFLAIAGMALVTYATRVGGWLATRRMVLSGRALAAMEAVPAAVLTAVITPMVLVTGPAETIAAAITVAASLKLPRLVTVALGVVCVVLLRRLMY
ncbi:AzlD family protein [Microbaculum marinum]|uniref:AzlD domain-containing protein n=1 Tax=Microbaculum marinum TaxID=1764581 RepID=A0AAW9RSC3_9HYPH